MTKTKAKKNNQVRSADPEAVRATVYFAPALHASMMEALREARKEKAAKRKPGPRAYDRLTLSAMISRACDHFIAKKYPQFKA